MKHKAIKIGLTSLVLALTFGGLLYTTHGRGHRVLQARRRSDGAARAVVRQEAAAAWLRRAGLDHRSKPNTLEYRFQVQSNGQIVSATYTGVVPDTFKSDAEVVLKGTLVAGRLHGAAQRRDGEVPVEVRSQAGERDALREILRRPPWPHSARSSSCSPSSPRPTRSRPSVAGARRRNTRLIESGIGAFYTVAALMTVASGRHHLRVRRRRLFDPLRPALLRQRPAALLQDHVVLGRPRRLGDVLGVPAVAVRRGGGQGQSRAASRADSLRRRGHRRRWRCSSSS